MNRYNRFYPGGMASGGRPLPPRRPVPCSDKPACPPAPTYQSLVCAPDSGCQSGESLPTAMAYVSWQNWEEPYAPDTALCRGTIFPSLDLPFMAYKGAR